MYVRPATPDDAPELARMRAALLRKPGEGTAWRGGPLIPPGVGIERPDEAAVRQAAALLDLDYSGARFGSVDEIYKSEAGRDILTEPTLLFADAADRAESFS